MWRELSTEELEKRLGLYFNLLSHPDLYRRVEPAVGELIRELRSRRAIRPVHHVDFNVEPPVRSVVMEGY